MRGCNCEIKCIACGLNCRIEAKNKIERTLCGEKKFSVWPDRNYFFKRAVNDLVFRELTCFVPEGIVVVDFSLGNILYFLNECWTRKLRDSGLKIILIADKNMLPMANFWRLRSGFSWAVVEVNSDLSNLINKIKRVMLGRNLLCRRTPSLTEHEMKTLCLLAEGIPARISPVSWRAIPAASTAFNTLYARSSAGSIACAICASGILSPRWISRD